VRLIKSIGATEQRLDGDPYRKRYAIPFITNLISESPFGIEIFESNALEMWVEAGDKNALRAVVVNVKDKTLTIGGRSLNEQSLADESSGLLVKIGLPLAPAVCQRGSGSIDIHNIDQEALDISVEGAGDVSASGRAGMFMVANHGSGRILSHALDTERAIVSLSGSGRIEVNPHEQMVCSLSGSGVIAVKGRPKDVTQTVTGSGKVLFLRRG